MGCVPGLPLVDDELPLDDDDDDDDDALPPFAQFTVPSSVVSEKPVPLADHVPNETPLTVTRPSVSKTMTDFDFESVREHLPLTVLRLIVVLFVCPF